MSSRFESFLDKLLGRPPKITPKPEETISSEPKRDIQDIINERNAAAWSGAVATHRFLTAEQPAAEGGWMTTAQKLNAASLKRQILEREARVRKK